MTSYPLNHLIHSLPDYTLSGPANPLITGIVADSRQVQPGHLFIAFKGFTVDGHRFIASAIERGAVAVVVEADVPVSLPDSMTVLRVPNGREALAYLAAAWYGYPSQKMTLIGVTGTDGKTTTTNLIYNILKQAGRKVSMISTVNAVIGEEVLDTGFHVTTPDAPEVQRYLAQVVQAGSEVCVLETTSHGLAQHRVTACDFDLGVVTNITHEHLDIHGSLEAYRLAKARLFEELAQQAAILNIDDWSYDFLRERIKGRIPIISYGLTVGANVQAQAVAFPPRGRTPFTPLRGVLRGDVPASQPAARFETMLMGERHIVETPLVGWFNISNTLAALATTVLGLGVAPEIALESLRAFKGIPGRMERIDLGQPFTAMVDFAHTPYALRRALETARGLIPQGDVPAKQRIIAVFGCAGLRDIKKRTMMGHIAAELADITIITAEDPRTEDLEMIIEATARAMREKGGMEGLTFHCVPDRGRAIYFAAQLAQPGDVVIALGKGHEQSMCFGSTEYPWDDREAMRSALLGEPLLTLPTR